MLLSFIGCCFPTGQVEAAPPSALPDWEISARPQPSAAEMEAARWTEVFDNDLAAYAVDLGSLKRTAPNADTVSVSVKADYKDKALRQRLTQLYQQHLTAKDTIQTNEMQMVFDLQRSSYAITEAKLYSAAGKLVAAKKLVPVYHLIPPQTFADTIYQLVRRYDDREE
jgi:hypothetical protein